MKDCPAPGCRTRCTNSQFACAKHWREMPQDLKRRMTDAFYRFRRDDISAADVAAERDQVFDLLGWEIDPYTENRHQIHTKCSCCGDPVIAALRGGAYIGLEPVGGVSARFTDRELWHIIGFCAYRKEEAGRGGFALFVEHVCETYLAVGQGVPSQTLRASATHMPSG